MVYVSTDSVFDGKKDGFYAEEDEPRPLNAYAMTKWLGEKEALRLASSLVVRTNIYGWNLEDKSSLAEWISQELASGRSIEGFVDVWFTPILVNHLSRLLYRLITGKHVGLFHAVGPEKITKYDFARRLAAIRGFEESLILPVSIATKSLKAKRPSNPALSASKLRATLAEDIPTVDEGLAHFHFLNESGYVKILRSFAGPLKSV